MLEIVPFTIDHILPARSLWERTEGVGLSSADDPEALKLYLRRNPGLSFVAIDRSDVIGAALCGHDGRRGYLHHLAVEVNWRKRGVGRGLVGKCLGGLATARIEKCHVFVFGDNEPGRAFWSRAGWNLRSDLVVMSGAVPAVAAARA